MKKIIFTLAAMFCAGNLWAADTKISAFTADATPSTDDLMATVNDPGGTPANRKTTIANLQTSVFQPLEATLTDIADGTITENLVNTANPWADNEVADDITASNYVPLAGGTLTGELVADETGIEFQPTDAITDCSSYSATGGGIFYDDSEGVFKKCQDNVLTVLDTTVAAGVDTSGTPEANDMARFTDADTIAGITYAEFFAIHDDITWGAAAGGSQTHTYDTGAGTDPAVTISDDAFTYNKELVALSFTTSGADGTHYVSALNTAALSSTATDGNLAFLTDRYYLGDGTDYDDYLLSKELIDTLSEFETALFVINTLRDIDATGALTFTGMSDTRAKTVRDAADTIIEKGGSYTDATLTLQSTGPISGQANLLTDAAGAITITVNAVNYGTDTGDADIPDGSCDAAGDVGNWVVLISSAADTYALTSDDASNQFVIAANAAALTAGNELDIDGTMVSVVCIAAELWKVTGYMGAIPTDGGAAD